MTTHDKPEYVKKLASMTTKQKQTHTPAPWIVVKDGHINYIGDEYQNAIQLMNESNAQLMAAAPNLLEAAKHALDRLKELGEYHKSAVTCMALEEAIAKATGEAEATQ